MAHLFFTCIASKHAMMMSLVCLLPFWFWKNEREKRVFIRNDRVDSGSISI